MRYSSVGVRGKYYTRHTVLCKAHLVERVESLFGGEECGLGLGEVARAVVLLDLHLLLDLGDLALLLVRNRLLLAHLLCLGAHDLNQLVRLLVLQVHLDLLSAQLGFQVVHLLRGSLQLLQTALETVLLQLQLLELRVEQVSYEQRRGEENDQVMKERE